MEQTKEQIRQELFNLADPAYRILQTRLIPEIQAEQIIGVRMPVLRAYAKKLAADPRAELFLQAELPHAYYDENNLHAALIGLVYSKDFAKTITALQRFLPYVNNWATCDMGIPRIFDKYPDETWLLVSKWLTSNHTFTVRFAIVTSLSIFLDSNFRPELFDMLASLRSSEYYINMAIAWYFSFAVIKQYDAVLPVFTENRLPVWVHNKAIQKSIESFRVPLEHKNYLRTLKRSPKGQHEVSL